MTEFPIEMFLPDSDLSPIDQNVDKIIAGLTTWQPKVKERKLETPPNLTVTGRDFEDIFYQTNRLFLKNAWSDGLPLIPPGEERVSWILKGTALAPETVVGKVLPAGRIATVRTVATNLAMAGGRPEYLPVLIAAIEAIVDPAVRHQHFNSTTCSVYPAIIVNGPIAKQIRLSSGYGCLGPDSANPAGAAIGRAVRLILLNVGGAVPGRGSMAIFGGASRYTNVIFAEDEDGLPPGWEPLNVSYFGFKRGTNTVATHPVAGGSNVNGASVNNKESAISTMQTIAALMGIPSWNYWGRVDRSQGSPGVLLIARGTAAGLAKAGYAKLDVQKFIWENSKVPWSTLERCCPPEKMAPRIEAGKPMLGLNKPWPITGRPENIMMVVTGGAQSGHAYWMQIGTSYRPTCKEVRLPPNWSDLLAEADKDLGPRV